MKLTLKQVKEQVNSIHPNIKILNTSYKNAHTKLDLVCEKGHKWQATRVSLVFNRSGCPVCSANNRVSSLRLTLEQVKEKVAVKSRGNIIVVSTIYKNAHTYLDFHCNVCKSNYKKTFNSFMNARVGCAVCARLQGDEKRKRKPKSIKGIRILSTGYKDAHTKLDLVCELCGHKWQATRTNLEHQNTGCPKCARIQTKNEAKVQKLLELSGIEFRINDKSILNGKELDFYIPSAKLAIEINGEFWHSTAQERITKTYHLDKTLECEIQGIKLLQFWDFNELQLKWQICESMILNALNKIPNRLYARNCIVREISNKEGKEFCDKNHIQGNKGASIYIALEHDSKIVSVMSFGKSRFNKSVEWELLRFCNLINYSVVGSASKMLKYFEQKHKPKSLISYANRRFSSKNRNLYQALGFELLKASEPSYFYFKTKDLKLFSRQTFQRHKLEKYFGKTYDSNLTEGQIMQDEGFLRLYDCGNLVYVKKTLR